MLLVALLLLSTPVPAADVASFRAAGTASGPDATPQLAGAARWRTPLPSWSNASPIVVGDRVCALSEPTTVLCVDAATVEVLWPADSDYAQTLPPAEREAGRTELAALSAEMGDDDPREARSERDTIRWTAHAQTPDGARRYVQLGHGVVSALSPDGRRVGSVWLGPAAPRTRRSHLGSAASPVLAGDVLVVGQRRWWGDEPGSGTLLHDPLQPEVQRVHPGPCAHERTRHASELHGTSPFRLLGVAGNVREWVGDAYAAGSWTWGSAACGSRRRGGDT